MIEQRNDGTPGEYEAKIEALARDLEACLDSKEVWEAVRLHTVCGHRMCLAYLVASNGAKMWAEQCRVCGWKHNWLPKGKFTDDERAAAVPVWDKEKPATPEAVAWRGFAKRAEAMASERARALYAGNGDRMTAEYREYLATDPEWQKKRASVLRRCRGVCEGCGEAEAREVHHLTYAHIFCEFLFELVGLCPACHRRYHRKQ